MCAVAHNRKLPAIVVVIPVVVQSSYTCKSFRTGVWSMRFQQLGSIVMTNSVVGLARMLSGSDGCLHCVLMIACSSNTDIHGIRCMVYYCAVSLNGHSNLCRHWLL